MSTPNLTLEALRVGLAAALPSRLVTRSFLPHARRSQDDLVKGVVTLINKGEGDYPKTMGREAQLGTLDVLLIGQLMVAGDPSGLQVEQAELALAEEIKAFMRGTMPAGVRDCTVNSFAQSGQLEVPCGWVVFELEVMGDE